MSQTLAAEICVVGAGPVGGTLACTLAEAGVSTIVIDRAPLPPMEHPAFDGRAYAVAAGSRRLLDRAGLWAKLPEPPCPILDIRVSDGRVGRPASPLFLHFDHRDAGADAGPFGWMVEARALRVALNAHLRRLRSVGVGAGAGDRRSGRFRRAGSDYRWPDDRLPPGDRRRGARFAAAPGGWHSDHRLRTGDQHRHRDQPGAAAPQHRARAFPPAVRSSNADGGQPRRRGRRGAECFRHRLDRGGGDMPSGC